MNWCYYCGELADSKDHLEARTWTGHLGQGYRGPWVWSCRECNSILSDRRIPDADDRKAFVAGRLVAKYRSAAEAPLASTDGLEGVLLRYVEQANIQRDILRDRLTWAAGLTFDSDPPCETSAI